MTKRSRVTKRHPELEPGHPGEYLGEITIPASGKSRTEIAELLGVSRQTVYDLCAKKLGVSAAMALRLGKLFGDDPALWLKMQAAHDLWRARREMVQALEAIPTIERAA